METTSDMAMVAGHDCNFCGHNRVCRIKFQVKDAIEMNKDLHLTISCEEYIPAMNLPVGEMEEPREDTKVEDVEEKPKRKTTTKKKTVRRKTK